MRWLDWFTHVCACWKHTVPGVRLKLHALACARARARKAVRGEKERSLSVFVSVFVSPSLRLFSRSDQRPPALFCSLVHFLSFSFSLHCVPLPPSLLVSFSIPLSRCLNLFLADAMVHAEIEHTECARAEWWRDGASGVVCGAK